MNKTVLITGASGGIGNEICRQFLAESYEVVALARTFHDFEFLDDERVNCIEFDLTNLSSIPSLIADLPVIDVLVNNAGVMVSAPYDDYPATMRELTLKVNLEAPIILMTEVAKKMKEQGYGRIVNNTSIAGQVGHPDVWYGVTKSGLLNATKSFAKLLGSYGITVNAIASGPVITSMMESIDQDRLDHIKASTLTGRFAYPTEVAKTICWLGLHSPDYINGSCIDLNDGVLMR
ncbi:short-chain dehydrogenase [Vibrio rotiferianus]|uniref:Beta-ketoacyl-ACP reductase n=3 Tax=Vibrio rotiferianus TaxID=190895 RepID=A0A510I4S3_9VIBR|nr:SDR family oxidoreductase [Vibrio rotiferianus]TMX43651.1 short-chain dehydrogenase [Vibrio rotiferianus]TMX47624.1 short-chain dehydrogenase [Vibrio rotiferianus]TMX68705.1 short-chain dehydrogenase [Vibrio rotiferianus]BBL88723.1 beta-ketoacyl-ACP reductase [Vibrio rotiferianus]